MGDRTKLWIVGGLAACVFALCCASALGFFNLDPTFGGDGVVRTDGPASSADEITDLAVLPDGKLLAAARLTTADSRDFSLLRYSADGSLDPTFGGGDGIVTTNMGAAGSRDNAWDMEIQDDGKIVVAGSVTANDPTADSDVAVARYTSAGVLDDTFDGESGSANGAIVIPMSASLDDSATAVTIDDAGNIVLSGNVVITDTAETFESDSHVIRLTSTGAFDDTFDTDGQLILDIDDEDSMDVVRIADDDDILLGGWAFNTDTTNIFWAFAKLNPDGSFDQAFDGDSGPGNGVVTVPEIEGAVSAIAISSGAFTAAGGFGWNLARFAQSGGTLDNGFGNGGIVTTTFAGDENVQDLVIDGSAYVASGNVDFGDPDDQHTVVARYLSGGGADTEFAPDGVLARNIATRTADDSVLGFESANAVGVIDDANATTTNKIVTGGTAWFGEEVEATDAIVVQFGPDVTAPDTTITSPKPGRTKKKRVVLRFRADEPATFRCRLDSKPFIEDCESGRSFRISLGRHVLSVEATDPTGNVEEPPAKRRIRRVPRRG